MALALVAALLFTVILYNGLTARYPGANDFFQRYYGARAFFVDGQDTYSASVSLGAEVALYGRPYNPDPAADEYPGDFLYPFHLALLLAPLAILPYAWASAAWMALTAVGSVLAVVGFWSLFGWRLSPLLIAALALWTITFYPVSRGILLGQPGTFVTALQLLVVVCYMRGADSLTGGLLALTTVKPQISFLIIPYMLLHALLTRRYRVLAAFGGTLLVLLIGSFLLLPSWFASFLAQIASYTSYTTIGSPIWIITMLTFPVLGRPGEFFFTALFGLLLLGVWIWVARSTPSGTRSTALFLFGAACTLTVTHWITPRTATPQYAALLPALFYLFALTRPSWRGTIWIALFGFNIALWIVFLTTLQGKFEHPVNYMILPVIATICLLLEANKLRATTIG